MAKSKSKSKKKLMNVAIASSVIGVLTGGYFLFLAPRKMTMFDAYYEWVVSVSKAKGEVPDSRENQKYWFGEFQAGKIPAAKEPFAAYVKKRRIQFI